jgi:hypothetical protein
MQVMEVTIAVLDCPFMAAICDLDDINLKEEMTVLWQAELDSNNQRSPASTIAAGHSDLPSQ